MKNLEQVLAIKIGGLYYVAKTDTPIISFFNKKSDDILYILNCDEELLDNDEDFCHPKNNNLSIVNTIPLYSKEALNLMKKAGLKNNKVTDGYFLYYLIKDDKEYDSNFLDLVYEQDKEEGTIHDLDLMLLEANTSSCQLWLIDKGAKCRKILGVTNSTFQIIFKNAMQSGDTTILDALNKKGLRALHADWMFGMADNVFLNIDRLIIESEDPIKAVYILRNILKNEEVAKRREYWRKTADAEALEKIDQAVLGNWSSIIRYDLNKVVTKTNISLPEWVESETVWYMSWSEMVSFECFIKEICDKDTIILSRKSEPNIVYKIKKENVGTNVFWSKKDLLDFKYGKKFS